MTYTKDKPKVAGWYFLIDNRTQFAQIVQVFLTPTFFKYYEAGYEVSLNGDDNYLMWAGPIQFPERQKI